MRKIYVCLVISFFVLSCEKEKLPIDTDYPFSLSSDPIPNQVYLQDGAIKIRLYVNKTGNVNPTKYFFSYYILEGRGQLTDNTGGSSYVVNEDYQFTTSTTTDKETLYFKYFPKDTIATEINFLVRNDQGYTSTLACKFNIAK